MTQHLPLSASWVFSNLAIGSYADLTDEWALEKSPVTHVLNVAAELYYPSSLCGKKVTKIAIQDGKEIPPLWLDDVIRYITSTLVSGDAKLMVVCAAGISRSPTAVIAAVGWLMDGFVSLEDVVQLVSSKRPIIRPHPLLMKSLQEYWIRLQCGKLQGRGL